MRGGPRREATGEPAPRIRASADVTVVGADPHDDLAPPAAGWGGSRTGTTSGGPYRSTTAAFTTTPRAHGDLHL